MQNNNQVREYSITLPLKGVTLDGILSLPPNPFGLVIFVHGSGSSRFSTRNQHVARILNQKGMATLLFDLLTPVEDRVDEQTRQFRFDIELLASRLVATTDWVLQQPEIKHLSIGYFGASTGGGAALVAAAQRPDIIKAVVSRGGRPDLAGFYLSSVLAPTLLIVGGEDEPVIQLNKNAMQELQCYCELTVVPGATHLFEEPGKLDTVANLAQKWFEEYLQLP